MEYKIFIDGFTKSKEKLEYAKKHIKTMYVPYATKLSEALTIAKGSVHSDLNNPDMYKKNTPTQYFMTIVKMIALYTDLTFDDKEVVDLYDSLNESGAMNALLSSIPESEVTEFRALIDMCISDIYENERELVPFIETKIEAINLTLTTIAESLRDTLSKVDAESLKNIASQISNSEDEAISK